MAFEAYSMSDDQTSKEYEEIDDKITKFHKESAQSPTTSPRFSFPSSITKRFSLNNGKNKLNNTTSDDVSNSILKDAIIDSESTKNGIYNRILGKNAKFWRTICEAFALNFMAEMGDRSQITIISLSANQNFFGVCCGAIFAHIICLVLALTIGIYAIKYLSLKTVNYIGSGIFVSLAMLTLFSNREAIINLLF
ncbi:uncharacterized protein LOC135926372 isoform X2 [Gordionus sp. m RMFG-2023]|uniref:uncharacterized protein LOC135926372 isoform X2 n=2 Tax=Gordionus sp. m RMFG-2023 TaxID=3053472 RepID=UPI0031FBAE0F